MSTMYKWDDEAQTVCAVECEVPKWPNADADGETIYENTHFPTEQEVWERVRDESDAWINLLASDIRDLQQRITAKQIAIGAAAIRRLVAEEHIQELPSDESTSHGTRM